MAGRVTYVMEIEAVWIITRHTLEEGIAVLGGAKACLDLLACRQ